MLPLQPVECCKACPLRHIAVAEFIDFLGCRHYRRPGGLTGMVNTPFFVVYTVNQGVNFPLPGMVAGGSHPLWPPAPFFCGCTLQPACNLAACRGAPPSAAKTAHNRPLRF